MRAETYMVVDPRHDHSFRVPRPDLSLELGAPDACSDCHADKPLEWSAASFAEWWPERAATPHYGRALEAGRTGGIGAAAALRQLIADPSQPGIVRATAVGLLARNLDPSDLGSLERATRDGDPLVRAAAAEALGSVDAASRLGLGRPLLRDPVLAVRIAAAGALLGTPASLADAGDIDSIGGAVEELRRSQLVNADRSEAHIVLGALEAQAGDAAAAEAEYRKAIELDPHSVAARVNLADLYRQTGDESGAENALREALAIDPSSGDAHHSLGLALVRQGRTDEALEALEQAAILEPDSQRYGFVHAIAVHSTGRIPKAIKLLKDLHRRWPENAEVLVALASYHAQLGGFAEAESYAQKLLEISPGDAQARALLDQIRSRRR